MNVATLSIKHAVPDKTGWTVFDQHGDQVATGAHGKQILIRYLMRLVKERESVRADKQSGIPGITWDAKNDKWKVTLRRDGSLYQLGMQADLDRAIALQAEAQALPVDEFPALKQRYGIRIRHNEIVEAATTIPAPVVTLADKFRVAEEADAAANELQRRAEQATGEAVAATDQAIAAWNDYHAALAARHPSVVFQKSKLGSA